jgi:hypothetical protein
MYLSFTADPPHTTHMIGDRYNMPFTDDDTNFNPNRHEAAPGRMLNSY